MKMNVTLSPGRLLIFCIVIGFGACKKTDSLITAGAAADTKITQQFFNVSPTEHPLVKRIAAEIQKRNNAYPFVAGFARTNGFAIWDKAILAPKPKTILQRDGDSVLVDTLVYVPLVLANTLQVNGSILAKIKGDSIFLKYVLAQDYKAYPFAGGRTTVTADQFATLMLVLNREVFGHETFTITDERLFADPAYPHPDTTTKEVSFDTAQVDNLNIPSVNCMIFQVRICGSNGTGRTSARTTTPGPNNCIYYYEEHCYTIYDDSGGWGGGSSGGDSGGSPGDGIPGGGGGGPIYHDYPCSTTGTCSPPGGGIGWLPPVSWDDTYNPYIADTVIVDTSISNNYPCLVKIIDTLSMYGNLNQKAQVALSTIFGVNKYFHTTVDIKPSMAGSGVSGETNTVKTYTLDSDTVHYTVTISLNPDIMPHATKEYIAATITHEAMHAYIQFIFKQYYLGIITDSNIVKSQFPIFWGNVGTISTQIQEHNLIANNWVNTIANSLSAFSINPGLTTQMRDSVYRSLGWGGLHETDIFKLHPSKCDIIGINYVAKNNTPIPFYITVPEFPQCSQTLNYNAQSLKLRGLCD